MPQYKYLLVAADGTSQDLEREETFSTDCFDIAPLLADGWRPVHETPMGRSQYEYEMDDENVMREVAVALVMLVKDDEE